EDECSKAKGLSVWKERIHSVWHNLKIASIETSSKPMVKVGDDMEVRAWVQLGDLAPKDVSVQIYYGKTDSTGDIKKGEIAPMTLVEERRGSAILFTGTIRYLRSGKHGFTVRILPYHPDQNSPFETGHILWASEPISVSA
ncbi:MAG: hypothetical protein C5B53_12445, partial [Candidatus Melainabacteria bacterium]